jgi:hypothetical protein
VQGLGANFDRAQAAHDAQEPPEDHDCSKDGHEWRFSIDRRIGWENVKEYKCKRCGKLSVE